MSAFSAEPFDHCFSFAFPSMARDTNGSWASSWSRPMSDRKRWHTRRSRRLSHRWLDTQRCAYPRRFGQVAALTSLQCTKRYFKISARTFPQLCCKFTSQWASRNVMTWPFTFLAPSKRALINPERFTVRSTEILHFISIVLNNFNFQLTVSWHWKRFDVIFQLHS